MFELETGLIFWNAVSFAILVLLMYRWALPPLLNMLKERGAVIERSLTAASESQKQAEAALLIVKQKLAEANLTAQKILESAKGEGEKLKEDLVSAAQRESGLIITRAKADLQREKDEILSEIEKHTAELVVAAAGRILRKKINPDEDQRLIKESINECRT
ncbi:MAG: F0F1 ATP synthase subunit B [Candidatus Margulisiibacteriota bacterium]